MLELCQTKMTLCPHPSPHRPVPVMMQIHELSTSTEAWNEEVSRRSLIPKYTGPEYRVPKMFPLLSTLYILAGVAGKIRIHFSQFSETTALWCKNISIIPAFVPDAPDRVLCSKRMPA